MAEENKTAYNSYILKRLPAEELLDYLILFYKQQQAYGILNDMLNIH